MTPPVINLPALVAAAERATPDDSDALQWYAPGMLMPALIAHDLSTFPEEDDAYIALANPATVRALAECINDLATYFGAHRAADIVEILARHGISLEADAREP